jgi:hypothetical protein
MEAEPVAAEGRAETERRAVGESGPAHPIPRRGSGGARRSLPPLTESFNVKFKRETLQAASPGPVSAEAFGWLHRYNIRRRHSRLGHLSPIATKQRPEQQQLS